MGMNPFVTTQGFATFSMMTTVIGAVCNIILDPILNFCPQYGGARCRHGDCHQPGGGHGVGAALFDRQPHQAAPERENMPLVGKSSAPALGWAFPPL